MNVGLQVIRYTAALAMVAAGFRDMLMPALAGIPLMLGGLALLAASHPAVDRFVVVLETWRHGRSTSPRSSH
jgi:hypothetical protein